MSAVAASAAVKVDQGLLEGRVEDGLTVYRGIPFAAPPVGDLRWRAPQPAAKWNGVRQADKLRTAMRAGRLRSARRQAAADQRGLPLSQCLDAREVGAMTRCRCWCGSMAAASTAARTSFPTYSGEVLAKKGVVLVTIAYRVGTARLSGASGTERGIAATRVGQLRPARHDRRPEMDQEEHRGVRRRSEQGHDLRRVARAASR